MAEKPHVLLVTPALADANNGNWRTAERWARLLSKSYRVTIAARFDGQQTDVLLALHARRSHPSVAAFCAAHPSLPVVVALTGTDLYGDLPKQDAATVESLHLATRLIVLQGDATRHVPLAHRAKTHVVYQSAPTQTHSAAAAPPLVCVVAGHLRSEKDPATLCRAVALLPTAAPLRIMHIGRALDGALAAQCAATAAADARYAWVGELGHDATLAQMAASHVLIHPSLMEGGAQAVIEAINSGAAVVASRMSGNVGLLGDDYCGYFEVGDAAGLAAMLTRLAQDPAALAQLQRQCGLRAPLFTEAAEAEALAQAVTAALASTRIDKS